MGNNQLSLNTLLHSQKDFIDIFSRYYPIPLDLLEKGKKIWNWRNISSNTKIDWSIDLLHKYENLLQWCCVNSLADNSALPWTKKLIKTFVKEGKWKWEDIMRQEKIIQSPKLLAFCLPHWEKGKKYGYNEGRYDAFQFADWGENAETWAHNVVENCPNLRWDWLSNIQKFPWTIDFIEKHKHELDWHLLSWNEGLPWNVEFIKQFENYLDWNRTPFFPSWNLELLKAFEERLNWRGLTVRNITWTQDIVEHFSDKIWWEVPDHGYGEGSMRNENIINSPDFLWTPTLFEKVKENVEKHFKMLEDKFLDIEFYFPENEYWTYYCQTNNWTPEFFNLIYKKGQDENLQTINWGNICKSAQNLWSDEFIKKYFDHLTNKGEYHLNNLCRNPHFPWNKYIDKFTDILDEKTWAALHQNPNFTPNIQIIEKYKDVWRTNEWYHLAHNIMLIPQILKEFEDKWPFFDLSSNRSLTSEMIEMYLDKPWSWRTLSYNKIPISWDKIDINKINPKRWEEVFNSCLNITDFADDELLKSFLENLTNKK